MTKDGGDERVSLGPLHPVAALKALLKVDPDAKPADDESPSRPVDAPPRRQAKGNKK